MKKKERSEGKRLLTAQIYFKCVRVGVLFWNYFFGAGICAIICSISNKINGISSSCSNFIVSIQIHLSLLFDLSTLTPHLRRRFVYFVLIRLTWRRCLQCHRNRLRIDTLAHSRIENGSIFDRMWDKQTMHDEWCAQQRRPHTHHYVKCQANGTEK